MVVKTYYVSKSGNAKLSANFKVKEFASKDNSDKVLIDTELVTLLQRIRDHFNSPVVITSAYRTISYNASVGGSSNSNHVKGKAADIQVRGVSPVIVGMFAQSINAGGIGVYAYTTGGFVHVDTRTVQYRWLTIVRGGSNQGVAKIMPTIRQFNDVNSTNAVKLLQRKLGITQSGYFGGITTDAVKQFQYQFGLVADGIVGEKTWRKLFS